MQCSLLKMSFYQHRRKDIRCTRLQLSSFRSNLYQSPGNLSSYVKGIK